MADRRKFKIVVEKHEDGFVAYPVGMKGVVVGQGETMTAAFEDVRSAILFHLESFGPDAIDEEEPPNEEG